MSYDMQTVFGDEISVAVQPRQMQVSYSGFAGAHGLTGLMHGSRGYVVTVRGRLRSNTNLSYDAARLDIINRMENLEALEAVGDAIWTYRSEIYWYMRLERLVMMPAADGRLIQYLADGSAAADFVATLRSLL